MIKDYFSACRICVCVRNCYPEDNEYKIKSALSDRYQKGKETYLAKSPFLEVNKKLSNSIVSIVLAFTSILCFIDYPS